MIRRHEARSVSSSSTTRTLRIARRLPITTIATLTRHHPPRTRGPAAKRGTHGSPILCQRVCSSGRVARTVMPHAFLTLSRAASLEAEVARIGARTRQTCRFVRSAEDVLASIAASPRAIILDGEHAETAEVLGRLAAAELDPQTLVVVVTRDITKDPLPGAHVLVTENG